MFKTTIAVAGLAVGTQANRSCPTGEPCPYADNPIVTEKCPIANAHDKKLSKALELEDCGCGCEGAKKLYKMRDAGHLNGIVVEGYGGDGTCVCDNNGCKTCVNHGTDQCTCEDYSCSNCNGGSNHHDHHDDG